MGMGIATLATAGGGEVVRASVCMEDLEAIVVEAKLACPLSLALWYCSHLDSKSLQWESRDRCVSWDWSCCLFQSLASWYLTAYWSTMIFSIFWVLGWGKPALHDEVGDLLGQHMYSLTGLLPNIRDKFIPMG